MSDRELRQFWFRYAWLYCYRSARVSFRTSGDVLVAREGGFEAALRVLENEVVDLSIPGAGFIAERMANCAAVGLLDLGGGHG